MRLPKIVNSRFFRAGILTIISLGLLYLSLRIFFFQTDPMISLIRDFFAWWLELSGELANILLGKMDLQYQIEGHSLISFDREVYHFNNNFLMRKWLFSLLIFLWIFPVKIRYKIFTTVLLFLMHFLITSIDMVLLASLLEPDAGNSESAYWVSRTPGVMMIVTFYVIWTLTFKEDIYRGLQKINLNTRFLDKKLPDIIVVIYLFAFFGNFLLGWFDYKGWINFLFLSSQKMLAMLDYEAIVYTTYLLGENGSIYMEKGCLGFNTMMIFAAIVYLTSERGTSRWLFMLAGLVFLNFINITRFVFLFIHIQKNNGYAMAMDVHDMYNLVLYGVVFVLWIIWFEFFALRNPDASSA